MGLTALRASKAAPPAADEAGAADRAALFALALEALVSYLPADARARLACTHPALRASEPLRKSFLRLDLSPASGVEAQVTDSLVRGIAALARGRLEWLDVRGCVRVTRDALRPVLTANLATLRHVYTHTRPPCDEEEPARGDASDDSEGAAPDDSDSDEPRRPQSDADEDDEKEECTLECADLAALLTGAPQLRALEVVAEDGSIAAVAALLRGTAQLAGKVRVTRVRISQTTEDVVASFTSFLGSVVGLPIGALPPPTPPVTEVPLRITCRTDGAEASLDIEAGNRLSRGATWVALMGTLVAHPTLRELSVEHMTTLPAAVAEALGALIRADAPALRTLRVDTFEALTDAAARPLFKALAINTHLEVLECAGPGSSLSAGFVRKEVLPAVTASTGLRELRVASYQELPALREVEAMVAARAGGV